VFEVTAARTDAASDDFPPLIEFLADFAKTTHRSAAAGADDPRGCIGKVFSYKVNRYPFGLQLPGSGFSVSGAHQDLPAAAGILRTLNILYAVTDHGGRFQVDVIFSAGPFNHPRFGFAAAAALFGQVGTKKDVPDPSAA
jgi:hypothetical protein